MNATITKNIPTPALVLVICVKDSNKEDVFPIRSETSSVRPLFIIFADWLDIFEKSLDINLKASVNKPMINAMTPRNKTIPAKVKTKSFVDNSNITPPKKYDYMEVCCN
jgi:hypothetical protein